MESAIEVFGVARSRHAVAGLLAAAGLAFSCLGTVAAQQSCTLTGTVTSGGLPAYPAALGFYLDGQRVSSSYTDSEGHYTAVLTEPGEYQIGVLYKGSSSGFWITMVAGQSQVFDM
ncbi:MAG: hypothetical protein ABII00_01850, partial [Elusimicrobiota bacterium]